MEQNPVKQNGNPIMKWCVIRAEFHRMQWSDCHKVMKADFSLELEYVPFRNFLNVKCLLLINRLVYSRAKLLFHFDTIFRSAVQKFFER